MLAEVSRARIVGFMILMSTEIGWLMGIKYQSKTLPLALLQLYIFGSMKLTMASDWRFTLGNVHSG